MITEEQKKLLIKDLSARVPYNTWVLMETEGSDEGWKTRVQHDYCLGYISGKITRLYFHEITFKPYLRPMKSMTKEEQLECLVELGEDVILCGEGQVHCLLTIDQIDWLNAHHFDYRGLIGMGLALEAPEGLYDGRINEIQFLRGEFDKGTIKNI